MKRANDDDEGLINKTPKDGVVKTVQRPQGIVGVIRQRGGYDGISQASTGWGLTNYGPK